jgi:hypothetical protein
MYFEPLPQAGGGGGGIQCCARFIGNKTFFCVKKNVSFTTAATRYFSVDTYSRPLSQLVNSFLDIEICVCDGHVVEPSYILASVIILIVKNAKAFSAIMRKWHIILQY